MKTKRNYAKNTFSEVGFLLIVVVMTFIFSFLYSRYFAIFSLNSFWNYAGYFVCFLLFGGLGYYFSLYGQRNVLSAVTVVLNPILFYDSVRMWKYSNLILWLDLSSVLAGGIMAAFYTKCKTDPIKRKGLKRKVGIGIATKVMRLVCCVVLLTAVIIGKIWIHNQTTLMMKEIQYISSDSVEDIPDYENSLTYNIQNVSKIDPAAGWSTLSLEEKTEVLETIIRVECRYFGMRDSAPALRISYMDEHTLGEYNHETDELTLSYQYVVDTNAGGYSVTQVLLHEMRHRYQNYQVQLLSAVRNDEDLAKYEDLLLLSDAAQFEDELSHYISGSDGSAYSYFLYASQELELDAEKYANQAIVEYYERIQDYLKE